VRGNTGTKIRDGAGYTNFRGENPQDCVVGGTRSEKIGCIDGGKYQGGFVDWGTKEWKGTEIQMVRVRRVALKEGENSGGGGRERLGCPVETPGEKKRGTWGLKEEEKPQKKETGEKKKGRGGFDAIKKKHDAGDNRTQEKKRLKYMN